jgi:toxin ParE1/3/4
MVEFRLSPAAQADLDAIFDHSVREWGLDQALRYTRELEQLCATLAKAPGQGADCGHIRPGYRRGVVGSHVVYFRVEPYGIAVVRILHARMDAPRHL